MIIALACALPTLLQSSRVALPRHINRHSSPQLFFGAPSLPAVVDELIDPSISRAEVLPLWKQFRSCYPNEEAAVEAARKNVIVLLPFINTKDNIRFNYQILGDELGFSDAERLEVIQKNPGVLANVPGALAESSQGEVRASIAFVEAAMAIPEPIRFAIPSVTGLAFVLFTAKRLQECAGGICG